MVGSKKQRKNEPSKRRDLDKNGLIKQFDLVFEKEV
ncbi:hypothetical protein Sgly_2009 [Syntrophobotulus glycolicus DSM 8271]|uniref:Uncharacterized protein n=1 Tax=Syntrophobotulus glycolicus (strain DSM 8271 / FlGlyR) TaxID=645991 RepID=F0T1G1_SYNGF|nr:hypothetical protein Sgly_2009 [Syntrophobotulus glycolicus DSM 8271]